jgi:hypothetical protein
VLLIVPCVLTLPVAAYGVLLSFLIGAFACFDTCGSNQGQFFQSSAGAVTVLVAELILGLTAFATLIAGLLAEPRRRLLGRVSWVLLLLSCAGAGLLLWSP